MSYKYDDESGKLVIDLNLEKEKKILTHKDGLKIEVKILLLIGFSIVIVFNCFEENTILSNILDLFGKFKFIMFIIPIFFAVRVFKKNFKIELPRELEIKSKIIKEKQVRTLFDLPFGSDEEGRIFCFDIRNSPHLLIGGASGWGKSVLVHKIITELIKISPKRLRLVLIDRKNEFIFYDKIPHLLTEDILFEIEDVENTLKFLIDEMNQRYEVLKNYRVRDIKSFNKKSDKKISYIFVVVDELADLMLSGDSKQRKNIEKYLSILGGKARACGIHLILATQRPDSNIVTGLIKANIPSAIAFKTANATNSEIIIDIGGAEKLKRPGEFIFKTNLGLKYLKSQLIEEYEIDKCVNLICDKFTYYPPKINFKKEYKTKKNQFEVIQTKKSKNVFKNELLEEVIKKSILENDKNISSTWIRSIFKIGAEKSKKIIEELDELNFISKFESSNKARKIIITLEDLESYNSDRVV